MSGIISRADARAASLKRYFTGKPCKNGHVAERFVDCRCCECVREWRAIGYIKNAESRREYSNLYYHQNKEARAVYLAENKEAIREVKREYKARLRAAKKAATNQ